MLCTPIRSGGDLLRVFRWYLHSIFERNAGDDLGDQFTATQLQPMRSAFFESLNTMDRMLVRDPQSRVLAVRNRTVANVDSIGLVVRICTQYSAGKS